MPYLGAARFLVVGRTTTTTGEKQGEFSRCPRLAPLLRIHHAARASRTGRLHVLHLAVRSRPAGDRPGRAAGETSQLHLCIVSLPHVVHAGGWRLDARVQAHLAFRRPARWPAGRTRVDVHALLRRVDFSRAAWGLVRSSQHAGRPHTLPSPRVWKGPGTNGRGCARYEYNS